MKKREESKKTPLTLKEYEEQQIKEILGSDNKYFTGQELGHSPTDDEAAEHYVGHGGAENFAQKHLLKHRLEQVEESEEQENNSDKKTKDNKK